MKKITPKKWNQINLKKCMPVAALVVTLAFGIFTLFSTGDIHVVVTFLFK